MRAYNLGTLHDDFGLTRLLVGADLQAGHPKRLHGRSFVRYGRQEVSLNRERLVGVPDWANTRRGSAGTRAQLVRGRLVLEGNDIRPMIVRRDRGNRADSTARLRTLSLGATTHLRVLIGGATVRPGAFLSTTPGGAHVEHWGYLGTTFAF